MNKKNKPCATPHPTRDGIKCWGKQHDRHFVHWATVIENGVLKRIEWSV